MTPDKKTETANIAILSLPRLNRRHLLPSQPLTNKPLTTGRSPSQRRRPCMTTMM